MSCGSSDRRPRLSVNSVTSFVINYSFLLYRLNKIGHFYRNLVSIKVRNADDKNNKNV